MLNIKTIRVKRGHTQAEVADFLNIARTTYTNIENGRSDPDTLTLIKLADYFDCSVDLLLNRNTKPSATLAPEEIELLKSYRLLSEQGQEYIRQTMFMAQQIYKKNSGFSDVEDQKIG